MAVLYTNNAISTLAASITNTATSFSVASGQGALFPNPTSPDIFYATLYDNAGNIEIVKVTARSTDTLTVVRGQDGTTGRAYSAGDKIELRLTKAVLDQLKLDATSSYLPLSGGQMTGALGIGTAASAGTNIQIGRTLTGNTSGNSVYNSFTIASDVTASASGFQSYATTTAASFTVPALYHFIANQTSIGAGSSVTSQYGFYASASLTTAANNYGFYSNLAAASGRYNFFANGTAVNYFGSTVLIGTLTDNGTDKLQVSGSASVSGAFTAGTTKAKVYQDLVTAITASTATTTIDLSLGNTFVVTVSANTTLSFTNAPSGTDVTSFTIITVNDATAGRALSFPAAATWAGGSLPPRTTAASKQDVWTFYTRDAGTSYVGSLAIANF